MAQSDQEAPNARAKGVRFGATQYIEPATSESAASPLGHSRLWTPGEEGIITGCPCRECSRLMQQIPYWDVIVRLFPTYLCSQTCRSVHTDTMPAAVLLVVLPADGRLRNWSPVARRLLRLSRSGTRQKMAHDDIHIAGTDDIDALITRLSAWLRHDDARTARYCVYEENRNSPRRPRNEPSPFGVRQTGGRYLTLVFNGWPVAQQGSLSDDV